MSDFLTFFPLSILHSPNGIFFFLNMNNLLFGFSSLLKTHADIWAAESEEASGINKFINYLATQADYARLSFRG